MEVSMDWNDYSEKYYEEPDDIIASENKCLEKIISRYDIKGEKCLDLGCGLGHWTVFMGNLGANVIGADPSEEAIKYCLKNHKKQKFIKVSSMRLPFNKNTFSCILLAWVLQEIIVDNEFVKLMRNIEELLTPNGLLIIAENIYPDNRKMLMKTLFGDIFLNEGGKPDRLRLFSQNSVSEVMMQFKLGKIQGEAVGHSFFEVYRKSKNADVENDH